MALEGEIPNWIWQAGGALVGMFGLGKIWGSLVQKDEAQENKIAEIKVSLDEAIKARDIQMDRIFNMFVDEKGDARFITYSSHDIMQAHCQALIQNDMMHIRETLDDIKLTINRRRSDRRLDDST